MPWLIAGFLTMLFLVPFDSIQLPFNLGVDAKLDRFAVGALALFWLASFASGGRFGPLVRLTHVHGAIVLFVAVAVLSVVLRLPVLSQLGEADLALKKLVLLFSYVAFFVMVATTLRPSELRNFGFLLVGLACLTSIGTIYEFRSGTNVFFDWRNELLGGFATLIPEPPDPDHGAPSIVGPTLHGLAATALLAMAFPFALVQLLQPGPRKRKIVLAIAAALILTGMIATQRKTAVMAPIGVSVVLLAFRPRQMLRLIPFGLAALLAVQAVAPGALGSIKSRLLHAKAGDGSTLGRTRDYDAVAPELVNRPVIGRGYGSYDPHRYRILDNAYLALLIETGIAGTAAFMLMIVVVLVAVRPAVGSGDRVRGPPALAAAAGAGGFGVVTILFDSLSFPQAPYMFFFLAGVAAICSRPIGARRPWPYPEQSNADISARERLHGPSDLVMTR